MISRIVIISLMIVLTCGFSDDMSEVSSTTSTNKPWRVKGGKRPKKGKLRRLYRHLDDV